MSRLRLLIPGANNRQHATGWALVTNGAVLALALVTDVAAGQAEPEKPASTSPSGAPSSTATTAPPTQPTERVGDEEYEQWRAAQDRLVQEQRRAEYKRLFPQVEGLKQGSDLDAIEKLVGEIEGSAILDPVRKGKLAAPLRDRQVLLLCGKAIAALAAGKIEDGRMLIIEASNAYGMRVEGAPANVVGAIAQAQARYVDAAVGRSEQAAAAGDYDVAIRYADQARGMLALMVRANGPEAQRARSQVASVDRLLVKHEVGKTLAKAKEAEARHQMRLALFHYNEARRAGVNTDEALSRVESYRRSPGLEATISFVVPGLSQLAHSRVLAGGWFFTSTVAAAAGGVLLHVESENRYSEYQAATDPNEAQDLYEGITPLEIGSYALFGTALVLHVWNIIDAYSDAQEHNRLYFQ